MLLVPLFLHLQGRSFCIFRVCFKTVKDHVDFLDKFSTKETVGIRGKDVRIRVRDRSVNLVRIRIQHFKFDDDLSLLGKRLRTVGEINNALRATKKNMDPGTVGIPFEFYLKFWDVIGVHFLDMMNSVLEKDKLQPSQGRAAIRLFPKIPTPSKITDK